MGHCRLTETLRLVFPDWIIHLNAAYIHQNYKNKSKTTKKVKEIKSKRIKYISNRSSSPPARSEPCQIVSAFGYFFWSMADVSEYNIHTDT